jgi:hypothetical protein
MRIAAYPREWSKRMAPSTRHYIGQRGGAHFNAYKTNRQVKVQ